MKRKSIKAIALVVMLVTMVSAPLTAQIFLQKQKTDISPRAAKTGSGHEWIIVPIQGIDIDQYAATPLGSGAVALTLLGGAYAFAKSRRKK